uniref:E3 ubiquitin-protein ligase PPP1R11 n=1 Tax=Steinernema glaseri TaxID=37863 RepID=A0A1I8AJG6_9BILA
MRPAPSGTQTVTTTEDPPQESEQPTQPQYVLRLRNVEERPRVTWTADTVDNEHMGRLKSNCCCIYVKPRKWDDPSTWEQDENETEHCRGHTLPPPRKPEDKEGKDDGSGGCCDH